MAPRELRPRHEDDLPAEAYASGGTVSVLSLVEHLEDCAGDAASRTAALLIRQIAMGHPEVLDIYEASVPYCAPRR